MKQLLLSLLISWSMGVFAAGSGDYQQANNELSDKASLKRGFDAYINYCLGCHQLQYQRYNRIFVDLGLGEQIAQEKYLSAGEKVGQPVLNAMADKDAINWFGTTAPDLTNMARLKSSDYIYTYLRSFYRDQSRPFGVNNTTFKDVVMPHVLQPLQGLASLNEQGQLTQAVGGELTPAEFDAFVQDLTNFLEYVAEPNKLERQTLGYWVLGFLVIWLVLVYLLQKEFWQDIQ